MGYKKLSLGVITKFVFEVRKQMNSVDNDPTWHAAYECP